MFLTKVLCQIRILENILKKRSCYKADTFEKQGYAYFCGDIVYQFKVDMTDEEAAKVSMLCALSREVLELAINGKNAGKLLWKPYRFDVKGLFREGTNEVTLKATVPMWNLFCDRGEEIPLGLCAAPWLEA